MGLLSITALGANFDFIIFDYNQDEIITYGCANVNTTIFIAMTRATWDTSFYKIAEKIFEYIPSSGEKLIIIIEVKCRFQRREVI